MRPDPRVLLADVDRATTDIVRFTEGMDRMMENHSSLPRRG